MNSMPCLLRLNLANHRECLQASEEIKWITAASAKKEGLGLRDLPNRRRLVREAISEMCAHVQCWGISGPLAKVFNPMWIKWIMRSVEEGISWGRYGWKLYGLYVQYILHLKMKIWKGYLWMLIMNVQFTGTLFCLQCCFQFQSSSCLS